MSDTLTRPVGSAADGAYVANNRFTLDDANQMRILLNKLGFATLQRNIYMGGSKLEAYPVSADGDYDLANWTPIIIDNRSTQFSGFSDTHGATLVQQVRFLVRVSDVAITATPKIRYNAAFGTLAVAGAGTVLGIAGAAACGAIADDYTGANQYQTVTFTLPSGSNFFKPQITIAGTGANPYMFWAMAFLDLYIDTTP